jgi:hypothetical protein
MPSLPPRWRRWHHDWMEFRAHARAYMAYYNRTARRHCRIRHCSKHTQYRRTVYCVFYIPHGRVLCQFCYYWMGIFDTQPDEREEGGCVGYDECWGAGKSCPYPTNMQVVLTRPQIGYIYGAYLWPDSDKPRYGIGFGASAAFALCSIGCAWVIRWMLIKENRRLRASTTEHVNLYGY